MEGEIINKVAQSQLVTIDLENFMPKEDVVTFDLKPHLFMELILKEKDFRAAMQAHDWEQYTNKFVAVTCSADAIIPVWAYMLVASYLQPYAKHVVFGDESLALREAFLQNISSIDISEYIDKRVVVKGCGDVQIEAYAYMEITRRLRPVAKSIMYGEPCSTVPIYKQK